MTLTKKQQNKNIPLELLFEIFKAINGYPNLVIRQKINNKNKKTKQQSFVWKIKCCENVLISSKIVPLFCGKAFKIRLVGILFLNFVSFGNKPKILF